jgi:hypothetical protein
MTVPADSWSDATMEQPKRTAEFIEHARTLERELAEARELLEYLEPHLLKADADTVSTFLERRKSDKPGGERR